MIQMDASLDGLRGCALATSSMDFREINVTVEKKRLELRSAGCRMTRKWKSPRGTEAFAVFLPMASRLSRIEYRTYDNYKTRAAARASAIRMAHHLLTQEGLIK